MDRRKGRPQHAGRGRVSVTASSQPDPTDDGILSAQAIRQRRERAAKVSGLDLEILAADDGAEIYEGNIENMIGAVSLPVGIAGPLLLKGEHASGEMLVPLATTEGTLVASYNRGMRAIRESGGAVTQVIHNEIYSSATFLTDGPAAADELAEWLADQQDAIRDLVAGLTQHGRFLRSDAISFGSRLVVNLVYDPADAMGINMITSCSYAVCHWLADQHSGLRFFMPTALQGDKKSTSYGYRNGRGRSAQAHVRLPAAVIRDTLHSSSKAILAYHRNNIETAQLTGGLGFNMHVANGVTALGLATGQDVAYVAESANAQLILEPAGEDLLVSLEIPSLYIGTVGGGTGLPHHRSCLAMMGCTGPGSALRLAEIFAGACLAGEISVLAAIASDQFVHAHDTMGRNRPGS
jgi:hydroxymethylglutaryl-CoA reductase (NADPH)